MNNSCYNLHIFHSKGGKRESLVMESGDDWCLHHLTELSQLHPDFDYFMTKRLLNIRLLKNVNASSVGSSVLIQPALKTCQLVTNENLILHYIDAGTQLSSNTE